MENQNETKLEAQGNSINPLLSAVFGWVIRHLELFALWFCGIFILDIDVTSWRFLLSGLIIAVCSGIATSAWECWKNGR